MTDSPRPRRELGAPSRPDRRSASRAIASALGASLVVLILSCNSRPTRPGAGVGVDVWVPPTLSMGATYARAPEEPMPSPKADFAQKPMLRPGHGWPTDVLTPSSWLAVIGSAKVQGDLPRTATCSACKRIVVSTEELLFSDIQPAAPFEKELAFLVDAEAVPKELDRGIWLWSWGHWHRMSPAHREQVLAARANVVFRRGFPPFQTVGLSDGRTVWSSFENGKLVVVVTRMTKDERASLDAIRSKFSPGRFVFETCPIGSCSHRSVEHIWLVGEGATVDADALVEASSAWTSGVHRRLRLHLDIQSASAIAECFVEREAKTFGGSPNYRLRTDRVLLRGDTTLVAGATGWAAMLPSTRENPVWVGQSVIALVVGDLRRAPKEVPATALRFVPRKQWHEVDAAMKELASHGILPRAVK